MCKGKHLFVKKGPQFDVQGREEGYLGKIFVCVESMTSIQFDNFNKMCPKKIIP